MNIEKVLNINCKSKEGKETLQRYLKKLKPFREFDENEDIPLEKIEKLIYKLTRKYEIEPQYMFINCVDASKTSLYSLGIRTPKGNWLGTVYGITIYETLAKAALKMFFEVRHNDLVNERKK